MHFHLKNDPFKGKLKLSQEPGFFKHTINFYNWKPVKEKWVPFLQQVKEELQQEIFNCLQNQAFATDLIL